MEKLIAGGFKPGDRVMPRADGWDYAGTVALIDASDRALVYSDRGGLKYWAALRILTRTRTGHVSAMVDFNNGCELCGHPDAHYWSCVGRPTQPDMNNSAGPIPNGTVVAYVSPRTGSTCFGTVLSHRTINTRVVYTINNGCFRYEDIPSDKVEIY
jgi:hypothetical protein